MCRKYSEIRLDEQGSGNLYNPMRYGSVLLLQSALTANMGCPIMQNMKHRIFLFTCAFCFVAFASVADTKAALAFILSYNPIGGSQHTNETKGTEFDVSNETVLFPMLFIRGYQLFFSPQTPPSCNFYPSCSQYGLLSIKEYGLILGILLTSDRLQRCNGRNREFYERDPQTGRLFDPPERNVP
jgi:uncharacterized protein